MRETVSIPGQPSAVIKDGKVVNAAFLKAYYQRKQHNLHRDKLLARIPVCR